MSENPKWSAGRPDIIEPEIIPPDRTGRRAPADEPDFIDFGQARHVRIVRMGPVGAVLIGLLIALFAAFVLLLLVGAFLIWIPLLVVFVVAAVASGLLRPHFRRHL